MKRGLVVPLVVLAISFALPAVAQEQNAVDPEVRQQIEAVISKFDDAYYKNDAAAIADLFAQDAVEVWGWDKFSKIASGQQAIERRYKVHFPKPRDLSAKLLQVYAIGNEICTISEFNHVITGGKGHLVRIFVRDADTWKIRVAYAN
jgi:ketosteroid isomerase-like protein